MTELAGSIYYANVLTSTTFELYTSWDGTTFSGNVDSLLYTDYSYTTVSATAVSTNVITVGDATVFSEGQAVRFIGNLSTSGLENNVTYYVANAVSTSLKVATTTDVANTVLSLQTTSGLTAEVYAIEGQAVATLGSTVSFPVAGGSDTQIQYNDTGALTGNSAFTYDYGNSILTLNGNANVSNLNATGIATASRFISNVGNGTPPLQVSSYTRVSNLSVAYANVSDFGIVTSQTTGTFYPVFVSSSATGNRALGANANISFNAATGNLSTTILNATTIVATTGNVGTINSGLLQNGNSNVTITANANVTVTSKSNATVVITDTGVNLAGTLNATGNANVGNIGTTTAIITTGNITTINSGLLQNGNSNITITSNANIALTSKSNTTMIISDTGANVTGTANVSGNANVGNLGTSGLIVAAGNISGANVVATSYHIRSITTGITAAGSAQGTATALTKEINVVGTVSSGANGVVLPTAVAGIVLIINNTSANTLNVYPASGAAINSGSANAAYSHSSAASIQYYATSSTQWYTVGATFA